MEKQITTNFSELEFRQLVREEVKTALKELLPNTEAVDAGDYVNMVEASKILDLSKSTVYKLVHFNKIPYKKQGPKKLMFKRSDLNDWLVKTRNLDENGTAPDGWNEKLQRHCIYQQPSADWVKENWHQAGQGGE